jgi:hypothetical protein
MGWMSRVYFWVCSFCWEEEPVIHRVVIHPRTRSMYSIPLDDELPSLKGEPLTGEDKGHGVL